MRRIRKQVFPPTPRNLLHLHQLLQLEENQEFSLTFQTPPNLFYQGPLMANGVFAGLLFYNTAYLEEIVEELTNVTVAGCDGTFKTTPKTTDNDCYQLFTFQVVYKMWCVNYSFPLVYALLTGKTEEIYRELLFRYIRNTVPLQYENVTIITDYERALINAIGCYQYGDHSHLARDCSSSGPLATHSSSPTPSSYIFDVTIVVTERLLGPADQSDPSGY
ncbi:uncharacterized protein LOC126839776 [Adelges cooleyi]|uniref:uncharacterized protein LOC126839776 n=1 Tax=Adelges cooleyi TaxID=133065 RepID=UPI0021802677|nr:uncharacterized protein LOC126839776 [Adelges cooleyi]